MLEVTNDQIWIGAHLKEEKKVKNKKTKFLNIAYFIFSICAVINTALVYSFFKIISSI